ncbi:hypothetical protein PHLCEN_2v5741 [Hermanssonia centrifuga]|uniref:Uncharacterized protein n=1 Tax=Hermanssonia centrifuga TaxID=98765 RepID=A0A2R6P1K5_9APHY|nr:hypothetical protein PHLCEN_2v5741 [Hermanssonia centrifuga]
MFPSAPNATGQSMNYAVVVGGGWIILCLIYYYFPRYGGRYWFRGPIFNVYAENLESEEKSSVSIME